MLFKLIDYWGFYFWFIFFIHNCTWLMFVEQIGKQIPNFFYMWKCIELELFLLYQSCKLRSFHPYQIYHTFGLFWVTQIDVDRCAIIYSYTYNTSLHWAFSSALKIDQFVTSIEKYTCLVHTCACMGGRASGTRTAIMGPYCSLGLWKSPTPFFFLEFLHMFFY